MDRARVQHQTHYLDFAVVAEVGARLEPTLAICELRLHKLVVVADVGVEITSREAGGVPLSVPCKLTRYR